MSRETVCMASKIRSAVTLTEGYFHGYDPFRFPQVFDSITKEDVAAFLRDNLTADRAVLSEIVPRER